MVGVESESGVKKVRVLSAVGDVNQTMTQEHCSVISKPVESNKFTVCLKNKRLNCAYLLALWNDVVSPLGIFVRVLVVEANALKCTPSSI